MRRDKDRGTGRTSRQMVEAPLGAVYVWCNAFRQYPCELARHLGRDDLEIVTPLWLAAASSRGRWLTGLVIDHALDTKWLEDRIDEARARVR